MRVWSVKSDSPAEWNAQLPEKSLSWCVDEGRIGQEPSREPYLCGLLSLDVDEGRSGEEPSGPSREPSL